ncbi:MAG: dephospho-CoA kinase [Parachlamydiaceae bacterium]|nr:dephospho-CoA kinase [Parachlamydiaceae bacterium]
MLSLKKVAITGGLSCGKSMVCRIFEELGAYVVSADNIVHHLLNSDANLCHKIVELLGPEVLVSNQIDRKQIAKIVFPNRSLLLKLEELIHPLVYKEIDQEYIRQRQSQSPFPLFIVEIPLLFESREKGNFDKVIVVTAPLDLQFERFKKNTGYGRKEFEDRIARQYPLKEKAIRADYVITNDGTLQDLRKTTKKLYEELINS